MDVKEENVPAEMNVNAARDVVKIVTVVTNVNAAVVAKTRKERQEAVVVLMAVNAVMDVKEENVPAEMNVNAARDVVKIVTVVTNVNAAVVAKTRKELQEAVVVLMAVNAVRDVKEEDVPAEMNVNAARDVAEIVTVVTNVNAAVVAKTRRRRKDAAKTRKKLQEAVV